MYELSLSGVVFVIGLVLWFRPVFGLIVMHRYWGPPTDATDRRIHERLVRIVSVCCIVVSVTVVVWSTLLFG
ncbi:hypothetical protein HWV23_06770 [Natronomonas halophila]|uniref:hypothetical protein n=1 Tax=Natronomonas halophila TaxID=2747817 RepID=UPI0015B46F98|nr:hypothetical protein [Natronomonas halophila]QLD85440.1 hypothetical protein HWV23_06770 [Natronomonas halophila]